MTRPAPAPRRRDSPVVPPRRAPLAVSVDLFLAVLEEAQHGLDLLQQLVVLLHPVAQEASATTVPRQQGVLVGLPAALLQRGLADGGGGQVLDGPELGLLVALLPGGADRAEGGAALVGLGGPRDPHGALAAVSGQRGLQVGGEALGPAQNEHGVALGRHVLQRL
ncbi:hypothetical protein EYF80_061387 [Liparis tanakae]|uniref:Uncharacterized protein n=1 Tax=Liparis tanakae TaxID=230148 RepID=A0A4Z2EI16_9TELE|nr:hypothetical protein EYF80_061387 [Liparis tanakae]